MAYSAALPHFLTTITDGMGNAVLNVQYDSSGRITQITNATGQSDSMSYNLGNLSEAATAPGNTNPTTNTYNTEGLLIQSVDADGNVTNYTYSSNNYLTSETAGCRRQRFDDDLREQLLRPAHPGDRPRRATRPILPTINMAIRGARPTRTATRPRSTITLIPTPRSTSPTRWTAT